MIVEAGDIGHGALHDWFIPTCVGQTPLAAAPGSGAAVHPHACGADPTVPSPRPWACPVHPHACGADVEIFGDPGHVFRFIPTRVGRTLGPLQLLHRGPRFIPTRVGRTGGGKSDGLSEDGSSPRVWGGRSPTSRRQRIKYGSSPRVWGRLMAFPTSARIKSGSSPRVWGRHIANTRVLGPKSCRSLQAHRHTSGPHPTHAE